MRLAFQHFGGDTWLAGNTFIENMFLALRTLGPECPKLILVVDQNTPERDFSRLAAGADEVLSVQLRAPEPAPTIHWSLRAHFVSWLRKRLLKQPERVGKDPFVVAVRGRQIDALFSLAWSAVPVTALPTVVWLPDFQHRRLPENFSPAERASRDRLYAQMAHGATRLLVTSEEVRQDLEAFAPAAAGKARRISYVASIPPEVYAQDPRPGLAEFHLPEKFIYLPNQFWKHKNHRLVFEALGQLNAHGIRPCIVSTGNPIDFRQPEYFGELMQLLSRLNIRDQFIFLGQVSRLDVFRLIRQSLAVLNPSGFEGLGLSVAESKSLGKRVLVVDLPALREQDAPGAVYFDPNAAGDLAAKMETLWTTVTPGPDGPLETAARAELPRRQAEFGRALLQVFEEARADFQRPASDA